MHEDLAHGPAYDFEVVEREVSLDEEQELVDVAPLDVAPRSRKLINGCYDNVQQLQPDSCTYLLRVSRNLSQTRDNEYVYFSNVT